MIILESYEQLSYPQKVGLTSVTKKWLKLIQKSLSLVDWWRRFEEDLTNEEDSKKVFNQQDVTRRPRGKVELWLCNGVQELVKILIT